MLAIVAMSMQDIGFKAEEVEDIYSILAAIILIGDVVRDCTVEIAATNWDRLAS